MHVVWRHCKMRHGLDKLFVCGKLQGGNDRLDEAVCDRRGGAGNLEWGVLFHGFNRSRRGKRSKRTAKNSAPRIMRFANRMLRNFLQAGISGEGTWKIWIGANGFPEGPKISQLYAHCGKAVTSAIAALIRAVDTRALKCHFRM